MAEETMSLEAVFADTAMLAKESFFILCIDTDTLAKLGSREQPNICYEHSRVCEHTAGAARAAKVTSHEVSDNFFLGLIQEFYNSQ